jgi:hypothetical protein
MKPRITLLVLGLCAATSAFAQAPEAAPSPAAPATPSAPAAAAPARSEAPHTYVESATVTVDGKADVNGTIQMEFMPLGTPGKVVQVNVLAKTGRKDIAKDLHKELVIAAGSLYKVKLSGDRITITKAKGAQNFSILLEKLDLSGVSILVKKG